MFHTGIKQVPTAVVHIHVYLVPVHHMPTRIITAVVQITRVLHKLIAKIESVE